MLYEYEHKSQTYTVAFAPGVTGLVLMLRFRLFLVQCSRFRNNERVRICI